MAGITEMAFGCRQGLHVDGPARVVMGPLRGAAAPAAAAQFAAGARFRLMTPGPVARQLVLVRFDRK